MATTMATGGLQPPIIDTQMPAQLQSDYSYTVKFSISDQNTPADFTEYKGGLQIAISELYTSASVVNTNRHPNGYIFDYLTFENDSIKNASFTFSDKDLSYGFFPANTFLKVQIRLAGSNIKNDIPTDVEEAAAWLEENKNNFTEWSTVCLLSAITDPTVTLTSEGSVVTIKEGASVSSQVTATTNALTDLSLSVTFPSGLNTSGKEVKVAEALQSAQFILMDNSSKVLQTSSKLYPTFEDTTSGIASVIITSLKYNLIENNSYILRMHLITKNLYETDYTFAFTVSEESKYGTTSSTLDFLEDIENGRIVFKITPANGETEFYIKRSSNEDNFTLLEDIRHITVSSSNTFYVADNTIKSGVLYKYALQAVSASNRKGYTLQTIDTPLLFDYAFLESNGKTLALKYNANLSGYKRVISETKIETIGNKYPYVRRNGDVNQRQITLSGLITMLADNDNVFLNQQDLITELFGSQEVFNAYRDKYNVNNLNDTILEREFRERVMDFLYENNVKLFRSPQEGNFLVKLMDINLTPNQSLGRNIYSFSCQALEIADDTIDNQKLYNIFSSPDVITLSSDLSLSIGGSVMIHKESK